MNTQDLTIVLKAKDEASKTIQDVSMKAKRDFGAMAKQVGGAMTVVGGAITTAFGFMVKSAAEAEAQMAQFETTMKNAGSGADKARGQLLKVADAVTKLGFDDEEAANSLAKLYQRTQDVTKATQLNALAMDLARSKNISLTDASNAIGMALSGNVKIFKQYGIEIDETKTPMEALIELQGKVKGSAEAFGDTFEGKMAAMKVQVGNLSESIGGMLLPILKDLLDKYIVPLVDKIKNWIDEHPVLAKAIIIIIAALGLLAVVIGPLLIALPMLAAGFAILTGPVGLIVLAIMALIAAGVLLYTNWQTIQQYLTDTWDGIVLLFNTNIEMVKNMLLNFGGAVKKIWNGLWQGVYDFFKMIWDSVFGTFDSIIKAIIIGINKIIEAVDKAISKLNSLSGVKFIGGFLGSVSSTINSVIGKRALGGPVGSGNSYLVGERGPELFTPKTSGKILPNGGGGNIIVNISGGYFLDQDVADKIGNAIMEKLKLQIAL